MKANEMDRYTFLSGLSILAEHPDGEWVLHSDAMQVIQALEAKIKGMIDRPKVEVVYDGYEGVHFVEVNGMAIETGTKGRCNTSCTLLTKALGMEGGADE